MRITLTKKDFQKPIFINGESINFDLFIKILAEMNQDAKFCEMVITNEKINIKTNNE